MSGPSWGPRDVTHQGNGTNQQITSGQIGDTRVGHPSCQHCNQNQKKSTRSQQPFTSMFLFIAQRLKPYRGFRFKTTYTMYSHNTPYSYKERDWTKTVCFFLHTASLTWKGTKNQPKTQKGCSCQLCTFIFTYSVYSFVWGWVSEYLYALLRERQSIPGLEGGKCTRKRGQHVVAVVLLQ